MKFCVTGKGQAANDLADKIISDTLQKKPSRLYGFTRVEFDSIVEYDILNILAFFYSKMNAQQKMLILDGLQNALTLTDLDETIENLVLFSDDDLYIPFSYRLMDRIKDRKSVV